jgi:hypothetical protein
MKKSNVRAGRRTELGKVSVRTLGGIKGTVETFGLYAPGIELS